MYDQYIDEGDYSSIIIMQDDDIHANLRYTQQAYVLAIILDFSLKLHVIQKLEVITVLY